MSMAVLEAQRGERIAFKAFTLEDLEAVHEFASNEKVSKFIGWQLMKDIHETRTFVEKLVKRLGEGTHMYANILEIETGKVIGTAMLFDFDKEANHAEIGYVLNDSAWGKGYGTETVKLISDFAFETLMCRKLYARVVHVNMGSAKVLEKNKFVLEGRLKDHYFIDGDYYDSLIYAKFNMSILAPFTMGKDKG